MRRTSSRRSIRPGQMEDAPSLLKIPKSECPDIWIRLPRHKWPTSWSSMEDPAVPLERNLYGHSLAGLFWERHVEKFLLEHGWGKVPNWERSFVNRELFLPVYVDDRKLAGKKQNIDPMWKVLSKEGFDLGEPTSFLDHVYLGCTQRGCETRKHVVDSYRDMFESRISAGAKEKLPCSGKPDADISSWSYDLEGDIARWRTKQLNSKTKSQLNALTTINSRKKKRDLLENCHKFAHKLFKNACIWRALVPDILLSVNKLARAVTKWTRACDKRVARFDLLQSRVNSNVIVLWETPHNTVDWDCFKTLILLGILETQNQHQEDSRAHPAATHPPEQVGCARNKHQPHTAQRKLRLPLLMQVYAWMGCQLLIIGIWFLKCSILHQTNQRNPKMEYEETRCETPIKQAHQKIKPRLQSSTTLLNCAMLMMFRRLRSLLILV